MGIGSGYRCRGIITETKYVSVNPNPGNFHAYLSPIARFAPTELGKWLGLHCAKEKL